jgi:hypothetical protein
MRKSYAIMVASCLAATPVFSDEGDSKQPASACNNAANSAVFSLFNSVNADATTRATAAATTSSAFTSVWNAMGCSASEANRNYLQQRYIEVFKLAR